MKNLLAILLFLLFQTTAFASDTYVNGYYRKDDTYVQPYYRTPANNTVYDNYSTKGNVNPYTNQPGYVNPNPPPSNYNYGYNNNSSKSNYNYYGY